MTKQHWPYAHIGRIISESWGRKEDAGDNPVLKILDNPTESNVALLSALLQEVRSIGMLLIMAHQDSLYEYAQRRDDGEAKLFKRVLDEVRTREAVHGPCPQLVMRSIRSKAADWCAQVASGDRVVLYPTSFGRRPNIYIRREPRHYFLLVWFLPSTRSKTYREYQAWMRMRVRK